MLVPQAALPGIDKPGVSDSNFAREASVTLSASMTQISDRTILFADLRGARVFVLGAGLVSQETKYGYRSGKTMFALERFWREYFARSNASLQAFGAPALTTDLY